MSPEFREYLEKHDLDEDEAFLLEEWVNSGHSVYENPWNQYDDYGQEIPFMKWYWRQKDPLHPANRRKALLNEAMRTDIKFSTAEEELMFLRNSQYILREEIILYRRFLAGCNGEVSRFEQYRLKEAGE